MLVSAVQLGDRAPDERQSPGDLYGIADAEQVRFHELKLPGGGDLEHLADVYSQAAVHGLG